MAKDVEVDAEPAAAPRALAEEGRRRSEGRVGDDAERDEDDDDDGEDDDREDDDD